MKFCSKDVEISKYVVSFRDTVLRKTGIHSQLYLENLIAPETAVRITRDYTVVTIAGNPARNPSFLYPIPESFALPVEIRKFQTPT